MMQAYLLDENTLLVPRRVRIGPGDPEWERWRARAVPLPKSWNGRVRVMLLTHAGQGGRPFVSTSNPEPEAPSAPPVPAVVPPTPIVALANPTPADRLTPAEIAPLVLHTEETVQRWCRSGAMKSGKIGRKVFVTRAEVARFLADGSATAPPQRARPPRLRTPVMRAAQRRSLSRRAAGLPPASPERA